MKKALLVIDHGSRRQEANDMIFEVVKRLRLKDPELIIHGAHMELAKPEIPEGIQACIDEGATDILVQPFMLSPGRHSKSDIPNIVADCQNKNPHLRIKVGKHLGLHPLFLKAVLSQTSQI